MKSYLIDSGYLKVYMPNHPCSDKDGFYWAHRLVAEKYLGRILRLEEVVHHINEIKGDNRIENMIVFEDNGAHRRFHMQRRTTYKITRMKNRANIYASYKNPDLGIVLYGPAYKKKNKAIMKALAEKTKRDLGLVNA